MALRVFRLRLSAKLWALVAVSLVALVFLGTAAILGTRQIQDIGLELYAESSAAAKLSSSAALDVQQVLGDVRAAPADIDLDHLKTTQTLVGVQLADVRQRLNDAIAKTREANIRDAAVRIVKALDAFEAASRKVFELSLNFAQAEAVKVLNESVAPAEGALKAALSDLADAADSNAAEKVSRMEGRAGAVAATVAAVVGALFVGLAALGYLVASRGVSRPIVSLNRTMAALSGGDKTVEIPFAGRYDEIGDMARAVEVFKKNMIEADGLRHDQESAKARAESEKRAAMHAMADEFEASVKGVVQFVSASSAELQKTAKSMTSAADAASRQSAIVAGASEQASANVQTVASAAEELSASISEIGRRVAESAQIASQAVGEAERTNTQVQTLSEAAEKIGDVVKLINAIAGQTNLLALNATIEAARAGEAGKGFAVVASEVKNLASQTARATEEIAGQVKSIQSATSGSIEAIGAIGQTIGRMNEIATAIAAAIEEQGAATQEIARNVQQASAGTQEVTNNITGVTKASSETGEAASHVLGAADELARQSDALSTQVDAFTAKIRAS
ncbi:MAG: HAMP domain-containing protein [Alphaproteobacteria bacterium]|nr:HAMP domain-containing protein [Alphaproteobacteria bacterium]